MLPKGVHHWTATHPEWEGPVSAYAIDDGQRLALVDPIAVPDAVRALFGSREVVTVLTSTWHERDAALLGFPVWAPAPDRPENQLVIGSAVAEAPAHRRETPLGATAMLNLSLSSGEVTEERATGLRPGMRCNVSVPRAVGTGTRSWSRIRRGGFKSSW